jgi:hypothetical protein
MKISFDKCQLLIIKLKGVHMRAEIHQDSPHMADSHSRTGGYLINGMEKVTTPPHPITS